MNCTRSGARFRYRFCSIFCSLRKPELLRVPVPSTTTVLLWIGRTKSDPGSRTLLIFLHSLNRPLKNVPLINRNIEGSTTGSASHNLHNCSVRPAPRRRTIVSELLG